MNTDISLLYCTFSHEEEALQVTRKLFQRKLIACANILGAIKSIYTWKGKLEESAEVAVLFKTISEKIPKVIDAIQTLHSYKSPAILEIPVGQSTELFRNWMREEVR